jgi:hypothetical protein
MATNAVSNADRPTAPTPTRATLRRLKRAPIVSKARELMNGKAGISQRSPSMVTLVGRSPHPHRAS